MLSTGAFNALLKTLEEPPAHVKFILATTEPQKLPATILSRCQRFDFKRISNENIIKRLNIVCEQSGIEITKEAMNIIAVLAEGAMRDALSILERCIQDGENKIDEDKIKDLVGIPKITYVHNIIDSLFKYDVDNTLKNVDIVLNEGKDINNLLWEMIKYTKDLLVYKASQKLDLYSEEEIANIEEISKNVSKQDLINMVYELSELENDIKWSTQKTIIFQAGMIKLCNKEKTENKGLEERVEKIEKYLKSGKIGVVQNSAVMGANAQQARTTSAPNNFSPRATMAGGTQATQTRRANTNTAKKMENRNYSSDAKQYWPEILTDLKQNGKIVLYTNLINTQAKEINDMTVGIEFKNGMSAFGKTVLEKPENVREISKMVSMACGKPMDIKYISNDTQVNQISQEESLQQFASDSDIPFNVIE